jgi:hypothetical protein
VTSGEPSKPSASNGALIGMRHELIFPAENGNPRIPSNLLREYKRMLIAAEIDAETRLHDLCHTAATRAGEHGMEEYVVAAMLGHGKKNVPRHYAMADQMRPAIRAIERMYLDESAKTATSTWTVTSDRRTNLDVPDRHQGRAVAADCVPPRS